MLPKAMLPEQKMQLYAESLELAAHNSSSAVRPSPVSGNGVEDASQYADALAPRPGRRLELYELGDAVHEGATQLTLKDESGLRAGDLLVLEPGTAQEEIVQIAYFGSVHLGFPTRHAHAAGAIVHRADAAPRVALVAPQIAPVVSD